MRVTMLPRSKTRQALHTVRPHGTLHPQGIARHVRVMRQRQVSEILTAKVKMAEAQRTARGGQEDGSEWLAQCVQCESCKGSLNE